MDKNYSLDEIKQLLLDQQFNNTQDDCSNEKFLELIPSLLISFISQVVLHLLRIILLQLLGQKSNSIMKEDNSDFFHLALKQLFPACFTHISIDDWEHVVLKDSLTTVSMYLTKIISQLDIQINNLTGDSGPSDLSTMNIFNLIQSCDNVLGPINSLLVSTLCQHRLIGSKLPSILHCIPDIMLQVWNHCALNKIKYESHCNEAVTKLVKKLYTNNKLIQTSYLTLLEDKIDFSDSQETEVLEESLNKLGKLAGILLQLDVFSAYSAFKTYCSLAIRYAGNLRQTLYLTPAVHAMALQVTQYVAGFRESTTAQADPLQARKTKLFRVFIKLILDLVENYRGTLRDTHTSLVSLLATMYEFTCESQNGDTSTLVEAAANNLVSSCYQDPYFTSELLRTDNSSQGFVRLCVVVMKKLLEVSPEDLSRDECKLDLICVLLQSMSSMEVNHFQAMVCSDQYKLTVSTLSVLCLTLSPAEYSQLESLLFKTVLGSKLGSLFACDVWCILLNSGPKSLFESTCLFLVEYLSIWDPAGYNFAYATLMMLVRRCLRSIKPSCVKKMFASGTLSYHKYPILFSIAPDHFSPANTIASSFPSSSHPYKHLHSLLLQASLDFHSMMETLQSLQYEDACTEYCVDLFCASLQASLVVFDKHALTQMFQCVIDILSSSSDSYTWLCMLKLLSSIPTPEIDLDRQITELLFSTILSQISENPEDYVNRQITTFGAVMAKLDKNGFLRVLKKLGKVDLIAKYSSQFSQYDDYDYLNQLGNQFKMQCRCSTEPDPSHHDVDTKHGGNCKTNMENVDSCSSLSSSLDLCDPCGKPADKLEEKSGDRANLNTKCDSFNVKISGKPLGDVTNTNEMLASIELNPLETSNEMDGSQSKRIKLEDHVRINVEVEKKLTEIDDRFKDMESYLRNRAHLVNSENKAKLNEVLIRAKSLW